MRDLFLYDYDFNLLGIFPKSTSINTSLNYNTFGNFEAHFPIHTDDILNYITSEKYLLFKYEDVYYPVVGSMIGEDIAVFGRTLEWLLTKRTVNKQMFENKTPEEIARSVITEGAGDFITLGNLKNLGDRQDYSIDKPKTLYDVISDILGVNDLGFRLYINSLNKFVFEVYKGADLQIIVSKSNKTAYSMNLSTDIQNMATKCGWYEQTIEDMGEWDAQKNIPYLSDSDSDNAYKRYRITAEEPYTRFGLECKNGEYLYSDTANGKWKTIASAPSSVWVYIDNSTETGARKWEAILDSFDKQSEAVKKLNDLIETESVDTETRRLEYKKDYNIGDTLRIQYEYGNYAKTVRKRVIGVDIYSDEKIKGVKPRFENIKEKDYVFM